MIYWTVGFLSPPAPWPTRPSPTLTWRPRRRETLRSRTTLTFSGVSIYCRTGQRMGSGWSCTVYTGSPKKSMKLGRRFGEFNAFFFIQRIIWIKFVTFSKALQYLKPGLVYYKDRTWRVQKSLSFMFSGTSCNCRPLALLWRCVQLLGEA